MIAAVWFGVSGLLAAVSGLLFSAYRTGNPIVIDGFNSMIVLGSLFLAALLGFLLGYRILLLPASKKSIFKVIFYGFAGAMLALLIIDLAIVLFLHHLAQLLCDPTVTDGRNSNLLSFGFMVILVSLTVGGVPALGVGILSSLLLYRLRSRYVRAL
jgi:hypothetical protein